MAKKRDRAFALFGAALFLVTSSALTIGVIYSMVQQHHDNTAAAAAAKAIKALTPSTGKTTTPTPSATTTPKETTVNNTKLQGAPLAGFTPVASIAKLQEIDSTPGTGDTVKPGATITVDYTGAVASTGVVFQSSKDTGKPVTFPLSGVIAGWSQGIPGMKAGGTRRLLIPANLAYGANPPAGSGIPANADLVFDVTVHSISK
jgi:FKBP-type peptidyl-prolyl cis-trans isomerase